MGAVEEEEGIGRVTAENMDGLGGQRARAESWLDVCEVPLVDLNLCLIVCVHVWWLSLRLTGRT